MGKEEWEGAWGGISEAASAYYLGSEFIEFLKSTEIGGFI